MQSPTAKFYETLRDCLWELFLNASGKDPNKALVSMREYAKKLIPEIEHSEIMAMDDDRLKMFIAKLLGQHESALETLTAHFSDDNVATTLYGYFQET